MGNEQHKYVWQGSTLVSEYYGGKTLEFFYDESGVPYGFSYKSSSSAAPAMYYYVTNLQGDVTNVLDASGSTVASYTYNAWGKVLTATGSMASINPIRYRGYYFDTETGLYYLKSRYYDPELARFVNADDYVSSGQGILGCNMFAYCLNSPVVHADYTGNIAGILVATLTLAASNPLIAVALVTGTAVLLKLAFEATARAVYEIGLAAEHLNDAVYSAKKAKSPKPSSGLVDVGGGAASPTPPGNNKNNWKKNVNKDNSPQWKKFDNVKNSRLKTSGRGSKQQYYDWDYTHNDIEVYNYRGQHLGSMDPITGKIYKPPVAGRYIKI